MAMEPHQVVECGPKKAPAPDGGREITVEALVHATALTVGRHEQLGHFLKRVTHLALNGAAPSAGKSNNGPKSSRSIRRIQNLRHCPNLQVLYLYDNEIEEIETLEQDTPQLSHLYLQSNRVREMRGLAGLSQLEKLFLSGNRIARLEGLAGGGGNLQELHLSNQTLPPSVAFSFDEDTLHSLSSLRVLTLANCHVEDARPLAVLRGLEVLDLSRNLLSELEDVFELLGGLSMLAELDLSQNPVTSAPKYRERVITFSSARLKLLDQKDVDANQRRMMQSHMAHKFRKHQEASASASSNARVSPMVAGGSVAESKKMIKHGTSTHQLRSVHVTASGLGRLPSSRGAHLSEGLGVAGASCAPASSAVLVRAQTSNNSRHD